MTVNLPLVEELEAAVQNAAVGSLRVGQHYGIHLYAGTEPVGTAFRAKDATLIAAAVNAAPAFLDVVRAVLAEHRPLVNNGKGEDACPECLGGIHAADPEVARSCGCWGLTTPVCSSCADRDGARLHPLQWPCPTVVAVTEAVTR